jgi:hypothetical protein
MAERAGFEPALPYGKRALQARALGQTTLPLRIITPDGFLPASVQHYTINFTPSEVFNKFCWFATIPEYLRPICRNSGLIYVNGFKRNAGRGNRRTVSPGSCR